MNETDPQTGVLDYATPKVRGARSGGESSGREKVIDARVAALCGL